ncbi:MAG: hypothetical protein IH594_07150 [Bacteroidales bacterium]|nr:hypothetical protein [Bacteroidales bacterium]
MMNDRFEDFIRKNRGELDIHSPSPEVWDRIIRERKRPARYKALLRTGLRIAAAGLIFILSYAYHEFRDFRKYQKAENNLNENLYNILPELKETEYYYNNLVDIKMKELQPLIADIPEIKGEISQDLSELDSMYISLKKDLLDNIANHEVLEAMIQNYRLKLQILEELLAEVKNERKNENHEKNKTDV